MFEKSRLIVSVILGAAVLVAAGCVAGGGGSAADDLEGIEWRLVASSVSASDLGAAGITATFSDGQIAGTGGVNSYGGACTIGDDGAIQMGEIASTLMAGSDEANAAETAYFALLGEVARYEVSGDTLTLRDAGGNELLVFERGE
jgi:heat shock protein HslJ